MEIFEGGVTSARGYRAAGIFAGLKKVRKDMAMIVSDTDAAAAGTYTTNRVKAAPVIWDMKVTAAGKARAIVVNSGNANACTGEQGMKDAEEMAAYAAGLLSTEKELVLVASTGVIGVNLDMEKIRNGEKVLASSLSADWKDAAQAILTTDTFAKTAACSVEIGGKKVTIGGMAKGSGMIHPNMAVDDTYNMISVDGDTSTNDSVLVLANGMAGNREIMEGTEDYAVFEEAFRYVLGTLARMIARDGEGATRFIEMTVKGAKTKSDAKTLARAVVSSSLVKAAFFGSDANWGRILCAMGYSGADFDPDLVDLSFVSPKGSLQVLASGQPVAFDEDRAKEILLEKEVGAVADCHQGEGEASAWGCDLTYDYVKINGDYRS